jgi:hypothetical protein
MTYRIIKMTAASKVPEKKGRGKPLGHRSLPALYEDITRIVTEAGNDGITAFAISKALAVPDPTIRLYLTDMVDQKKVVKKAIAGLVLYRIKKSK